MSTTTDTTTAAFKLGYDHADVRIARRTTDRGRTLMAEDLVDLADGEVELATEHSGITGDSLTAVLERWAGVRARGMEELVRLAEEAEARELALLADEEEQEALEATNVETIQRWVHEHSNGQVKAEPSPHPLGRSDWSFSRTDGQKVLSGDHECIGTLATVVVDHSRKLDRRFTTVVWDVEHAVDELLALETVAPEGDEAQADSEQWEQDGGASEGGCEPFTPDDEAVPQLRGRWSEELLEDLAAEAELSANEDSGRQELAEAFQRLRSAMDALTGAAKVEERTDTLLRLQLKHAAVWDTFCNLRLHEDLGHSERWVRARIVAELEKGRAKRMTAWCTALGVLRGWDLEQVERHARNVQRAHVIKRAHEGAERERRGRIADREGVMGA